MSYHVSNLGSFGGYVRPDVDGYVHTSIRAVRRGSWGYRPTIDEAREIARHNREGSRAAERAIQAWRDHNL